MKGKKHEFQGYNLDTFGINCFSNFINLLALLSFQLAEIMLWYTYTDIFIITDKTLWTDLCNGQFEF